MGLDWHLLTTFGVKSNLRMNAVPIYHFILQITRNLYIVENKCTFIRIFQVKKKKIKYILIGDVGNTFKIYTIFVAN